MLTDNEFKVLKALDLSEYGDHLTDRVWTFTIADNSDLKGKTISGAVSSLSQKGFVRCEGSGKDQTIAMTMAGVEAYKIALSARSETGTQYATKPI